MSTNGIRVDEFNIYSLGAEAVSYHLKNIHTLALQVTEGNIGILSLELEVELCYYNNGVPFIEAYFARGTKDEPETDRYANIKVGDWFVILWDEIHVFRDKEFRSTFSFDGLSGISMAEAREQHGLSAPRMTDEDVKQVAGELNVGMGPKLHEITLLPEGQSLTGGTIGQVQVEEHDREGRDLPENPHNTDGIDTP